MDLEFIPRHVDSRVPGPPCYNTLPRGCVEKTNTWKPGYLSSSVHFPQINLFDPGKVT